MTPEKIACVARRYSALLKEADVKPKRIDPTCSFAALPKEAVLAHVAYLCAHIPEYVANPGTLGKANRHLAAAQMCLSFVGLYTLDELREHNAPDTK